MTRIVCSSLGTAVWRAGLADPYLHWRRAKSAWELAVSWESRQASASGLPPEIETVLSAHPEFQKPALLVGIVEHRVTLDTPKTPSQNDLWCMLRTDAGLVSVAVEAKSGEEFDKRLEEWLQNDRGSKQRRLAYLCDVLCIRTRPVGELRYQLFHRAASAVLEARRWMAPRALMLVQSFQESPASWADYAAFAGLLGLEVTRDAVSRAAKCGDVDLHLAWVHSPFASDAVAASAV